MTFNKIESGLMKLTKIDMPVQSYVNDVVNTFAAESRAKGIEIEIRDIHRPMDKTNKGFAVSTSDVASLAREQSITMNKFTGLEDKTKEQGRTRWAASTRRLVLTHPFIRPHPVNTYTSSHC